MSIFLTGYSILDIHGFPVLYVSQIHILLAWYGSLDGSSKSQDSREQSTDNDKQMALNQYTPLTILI